MIRYKSLVRVTCLTLFSLLIPQFSLADYIGRDPSIFPGGTKRVHDNGTLAFFYDAGLPQSIRDHIETYGEAHAATPDLTKVYDFVNTLGFSNYVIGSRADTGQYLPANTFATIHPTPQIGGENYINQARQPLITNSNELFVLSQIPFTQIGQDYWQIKHYDLATNTFVESINPPSPRRIDDIAFHEFGLLGLGGLLDQIFFSTPTGIFKATRPTPTLVSQNFLPLSQVATPLVPGVNGNIAIGPDSLLYVRNFANGDVQRYNSTTGAFIDTFISHVSFPTLGTIQFGIDGNLHVYGGAGDILKFSASTGALLATTHTNLLNGRITFVPVPEPAGVLLALAGAAFFVGRRSKNPRG
jgi:hypothetical protein